MKTHRICPLAISVAVCSALSCFSVIASAQSFGSSEQLMAPATSNEEESAVATADSMEGSPDTEMVLRGKAEIRRSGTVLKGDEIVYNQNEDTVKGVGHTEISRQGFTFRAPEFLYRMDSKSGEAKDTEFEYAPNRLRGEAACVRFQTSDTVEMDKSVVTTCRKGDNSWRIELDSLTIDQVEQEGYGRGAVLKFGDVPVIGFPYFEFPAAGQRKSGFLIPTIGFSSTRGLDLTVPYYFNLAPNYDYTFTPRLMTRNGVMLGNELRWKTKYFEADLKANYTPHDSEYDDSRYGVFGKLEGSWNGFNYGINYNLVSDDEYLEDYSSDIKDISNIEHLAQNYWIGYTSTYWNTSVRVEKNQTIFNEDYRNGIYKYGKPYEKIPEFTFNGYVADLAGFELTTKLLATRFKNSFNVNGKANPTGDRFVFDQSVTYPLQGASWFVTPKARLIGTWYNLDKPEAGKDDSPSRVVPMFSIDSGLTFERDTSVNDRATIQTLEPRLYYAYVKDKEQANLPVFDSSLADMNFASIFTENTWTGYDRINGANHLTAALTTRMLDSETGNEWFRAAVGQRYYFNDSQIGSNGKPEKLQDHKADILASVGARLFRNLLLEANGQYNYDRRNFKRASVGLRWQPKPFSVVGLYYRYNRTGTYDPNSNFRRIDFHHLGSDSDFRQIDFSTQWPLGGNYYVVSRLNYSLLEKKWVEAMVGIEYQADCWTLRTLAQRYLRSNKEYETKFYFQVELRGLGAIGSSPLSALKESIFGYQSSENTLSKNKPGSANTYDYYK